MHANTSALSLTPNDLAHLRRRLLAAGIRNRGGGSVPPFQEQPLTSLPSDEGFIVSDYAENLERIAEEKLAKGSDRISKIINQRDAAQSELAALREELADANKHCVLLSTAETNQHFERDALQQRLTAAEQRNAELVELLSDCKGRLSRVRFVGLHKRINTAIYPAVKAPVKMQAVDCGQCPYITDGCQNTCEKSRPAFWNKPTESGASE